MNQLGAAGKEQIVEDTELQPLAEYNGKIDADSQFNEGVALAKHTEDFATAFSLYFTWYAVAMTYDSYRFGDMAQGVLAVPLWIPQLGFSGGLAILSIALVDEMIHVLKGNKPTYEKEPPSSPDEFVERIASGGGG